MKNNLLFFVLLLAAFSCGKETTQADLCEGVICNNGGTCVNGDCSCPAGYTGPSCEQEKAPVKIRVGSITLTSFPPTDNGAGWDLTSGPDVFLDISLNGTSIYSTGFVQNLEGNYTFQDVVEFTNPQSTYAITVWDYDDGLTDPDYMGGINFTPYKQGLNFPQSINLQCSGCAVSFTLNGAIYTH